MPGISGICSGPAGAEGTNSPWRWRLLHLCVLLCVFCVLLSWPFPALSEARHAAQRVEGKEGKKADLLSEGKSHRVAWKRPLGSPRAAPSAEPRDGEPGAGCCCAGCVPSGAGTASALCWPWHPPEQPRVMEPFGDSIPHSRLLGRAPAVKGAEALLVIQDLYYISQAFCVFSDFYEL